ncbi:MAG: hypothetical protein QM741_18775 [Rudaea sp.]|uniref:hypothetical protein n=1 Tax=Rudaea sp. TaxID=2136325 RepID=UPI0039E5C954
MSATYVLGWLLPLMAGIAVCLAANPQRVPGWRATAVGYGFFFGVLLAALFTAFVARFDMAQAFPIAGGCLLVLFAAAAAVAWRRRNREFPAVAESSVALSRWQWAVLSALLLSLPLRGLIAAREIWLRPLYPWDAWSAWAVKPKTWYLLGHYVPFVSMHDWLRSASGEWHTGVAWHYPVALGWIEVWFASAADGWVEPLINLPWLGLWAALLFAHGGQWRALGMNRVRTALAVYALGSLPLPTVHAALAGYADLWVATAFGCAVLSWMRWLQSGEKSQLGLALVCALALPWLKLEGWVWMACLLGAIGYGALPVRWRWPIVCGAGVLFLLLFPFGGLRWLCLHAGLVQADGSIATPAVGPLVLLFDLHWRDGVFTQAIESLFAQPNWHLLWWLTPVVLVWRRRALFAHEWLRLPAALIAVCVALLLFLFLFTDASRWAQSFTAINRLVLQLTPAWVTVLALLLRDAHLPGAARDTVPASAPHSDPA